MKPLSFFSLPLHRTAPIGQVVSFIIFSSYFLVYPQFLKKLWPYFELMFTTQYQRHLAVILISNIVFFGAYNLVMYFIYISKIPFFEQYRCSDKLWPWESDPEKWQKLLKKSVFLVLFNMFVCNAFVPFMEVILGGIKYKHTFQDFPDSFTIFWQFVFAMFFEDIGFYWVHKILHNPSLYWIHKFHHEHYNTVSIAPTSAHPLEYILSNVIPTGMGLSLLANFTPVHFVTIFIWFTYRVFETCDGHCGYEWSWGSNSFLPFKLDSDYHNFHHAYNCGNYGSMFVFWDNLMGTNQEYKKFADKIPKKGSKIL